MAQKKSPGTPAGPTGNLNLGGALKPGKSAKQKSNFFSGKGNKGKGGTGSK